MMEPKIRFKGFEGEWKEYPLNDCVYFLDSQRKPIEEGNRTKGIFPYYGASGIVDYINDYIFDEELILLSEDGANITDRNYPVCFLAKGKYWVNNHAHVLKAKEGFVNSFLSNAMERKDYTQYNTGMAMPKLNKEACKRIPVLHPSSKEQQAIASYFTSLDSQISACTSRLASLKQMKAASLQAMFPQEGETVPKIRFKGFEGEWKKVKLSEILTERHENSTITDSLPQLSFTIADGVIRPEDRKSNKRDFLIKDIDNKRYLVTKVGDIIYNPANVVYGAIHRNSLMNGVVSPIYKIFTTMQDSNFIECAVRRPSFITKLAMCTEGTVTKLKTLKPEAFLNMEVCITPSLEEQKLIGNYFTSLDRQISLQSQHLEKLKQIKSACLDKMFV